MSQLILFNITNGLIVGGVCSLNGVRKRVVEGL
jgi:hypothetical protein